MGPCQSKTSILSNNADVSVNNKSHSVALSKDKKNTTTNKNRIGSRREVAITSSISDENNRECREPEPTTATLNHHEEQRIYAAASENNNNQTKCYTKQQSNPFSNRTPINAKSNNQSINRKCYHKQSSSKIGLDEMIEERLEIGNICQNIVHFEDPLGIPIEEVYDGVHNGIILGKGLTGLVRLVTHKATGVKYAVKILQLQYIDNDASLKQLREEIVIMSQLDHPNIVRLEAVYESQYEIHLVQELCLGGELYDKLDEQPNYHYTESECAKLVKQMISAVRYIHMKGIIHRDLKLENFLFSNTVKDSELKLIDFGLSKHFHYGGEIHRDVVGTPYTIAPEILKGRYDERCDVWAIGVITFLLLSGVPPFGGCGGPKSVPMSKVRTNILTGSYQFVPKETWDNISPLARTFINDLLKINPKERPTAYEAQSHEWLQEWTNRNNIDNDNILSPNVIKALITFKEMSNMRKLFCEVLSYTLLPSQIINLRHEFEKIDIDGSGEISLDAMKKQIILLKGITTNNNNVDNAADVSSISAAEELKTNDSTSLLLTENDVQDIFNAMKMKKTESKIHWHEFIAAGLSQCNVDDRNLRLAFNRLDSDHKGYIIPEDIMDLIGSSSQQISDEEVQRMWIDCVNALKCQQTCITYDDFLLLMKGQQRQSQQQIIYNTTTEESNNMGSCPCNFHSKIFSASIWRTTS